MSGSLSSGGLPAALAAAYRQLADLAPDFDFPGTTDQAARAAVESAARAAATGEEDTAGPGLAWAVTDILRGVMMALRTNSRLVTAGYDIDNPVEEEGWGEIVPLVTNNAGDMVIGMTRRGAIVVSEVILRGPRDLAAGIDGGWLYSHAVATKGGKTALGVRYDDGKTDLVLSPLSLNLSGVNFQTPRLEGWAGAINVRQDGAWTYGTVFGWDGLPVEVKQGNTRQLVRRKKITTAIPKGQAAEPVLVILAGGQSLAGVGHEANEYLAAGPIYPANVFYPCDSAAAAINVGTLGATPATMATAVDLVPMYHPLVSGTFPVNIISFMIEYLHRLDLAQSGGVGGSHADFPSRRTGPGIVGFTAYEGGQKIETFIKGSNQYNLTLQMAGQIKEIANAYGRTVRFGYVFIHGEAGALSGDYGAHLSQLMDDYRTDLDAIADGGETLLFVSQIAMQDEQSTASVDSSDDQIAYLQTAPTRVYSAGPQHPGRLRDEIHPDFDGRVVCNEARAHLIYEAFKGRPRAPLVPVCVRTGATVVCTFPESSLGPLTLDTDWMPAITNHNVGWADNGDGNSVTVSSVTVSGANTVTVVLSDTPTGTGQKLRWGQNSAGDTTEDAWSSSRIPIYRQTTIKSLARQIINADIPETIRHYVMRGDFAVTT